MTKKGWAREMSDANPETLLPCSSFPWKGESSGLALYWIPAFAGMTAHTQLRTRGTGRSTPSIDGGKASWPEGTVAESRHDTLDKPEVTKPYQLFSSTEMEENPKIQNEEEKRYQEVRHQLPVESGRVPGVRGVFEYVLLTAA